MTLNREGICSHCGSDHTNQIYPKEPYCQYCEVHYFRGVVIKQNEKIEQLEKTLDDIKMLATNST